MVSSRALPAATGGLGLMTVAAVCLMAVGALGVELRPPPPPPPTPPPLHQHQHQQHNQDGPPRRRHLLRADYELINRLLVERVPSDAPIDNVLEAADWLKLLASPHQQQVAGVQEGDDEKLERQLRQLHLSSLVRFTSLLKLLADERSECNLVGHRIIARNVEALTADIMVPLTRLGPMRRVEQVVRQVALEHAEGCKHKYPELLVWARRHAHNEPAFRHLERMMLDLIEVQRTQIQTYWSKDEDANNLVGLAKIVSLRDNSFAVVLYRMLENLGSDDPRIEALQPRGDPTRPNQWVLDEKTIRELADEHLFKQCDWLLKVTGNVVKPAMSAQRLYEPEDRYRKVDAATRQLMFYMGYFRVCELMLGPDRQAIEQNLISLSWRIVQNRPYGKRDAVSTVFNLFRG